jgi:hypothetical protein
MDEYIGLDVSMKETAVSIRRGGQRVWRGKCASDPKVIADLIRQRAPAARRVVFETGPLSVWFHHALTQEGLPAICIDARHAKAALDMAANKTDANDADGLAHLAEAGFFREVRVKGFESMSTRTLVAAGEGGNRALEPDPGADEDLRRCRAGGEGECLREEHPSPPRRSAYAGADRAPAPRGVARRAHASGRAG